MQHIQGAPQLGCGAVLLDEPDIPEGMWDIVLCSIETHQRFLSCAGGFRHVRRSATRWDAGVNSQETGALDDHARRKHRIRKPVAA